MKSGSADAWLASYALGGITLARGIGTFGGVVHSFSAVMLSCSMNTKTVGASGQISLGKQYAGRTVVVESPEEGVWVIRTAQVIPDNEMWLHREPALSKMAKGLAWADAAPASVTDLDQFEADILRRWEASREDDSSR